MNSELLMSLAVLLERAPTQYVQAARFIEPAIEDGIRALDPDGTAKFIQAIDRRTKRTKGLKRA